MRQSNFELLRIVCMAMIVIMHLNFCKISPDLQYTFEYNVAAIFRSLSVCAVNVFVLISGFWGIRFKLDRILGLSTQSCFYLVLNIAVACLFFNYSIATKDIFVLLPIITKKYWFITAYAVLMCLAPFLNQFISGFNRHQHKMFLMICGCLFYGWPTICWLINADQLVPDAGYGIVNFVCLYMFGRYIRIYEVSLSRFSCLALYLGGALVLLLAQIGISALLGFEFTSLYSYNTVPVLVESIGLFLLFKSFTLCSPMVNVVAKNILSAYLIHTTPYVWPYVTNLLSNSYWGGYLINLLLYTISILMVAIVIEKIRLFLFSRIDAYVCTKISALITGCFNYCRRVITI